MNQIIGVNSLIKLGVLYEGDLFDLACLLLKINGAKDKDTNAKSYYTVKGLAGKYALLTNIDHDQILEVVTNSRLPLGAIIEYDEKIK